MNNIELKRYVKTEDNIYDTLNAEYTYAIIQDKILCRVYTDTLEEFGEETVWENLGKICKTSENLEELMDEFVMTHYFKETNYTKCEVLNEDEVLKVLMIKAVRLKKQHNKDKDLKK